MGPGPFIIKAEEPKRGKPWGAWMVGNSSSGLRNLWAAPPEGGVGLTARAPGWAASERHQGRTALHRQDPCGLRTSTNE